MFLASQTRTAQITDLAIYGEAATVNAAVVAMSGGRVPCYAIKGKRVAFKWVSIGSSCVIGRAEATAFLRRVGVDIASAESAAC